MNINETVKVACPICGSEEAKHLFWTKDYTFNCSEDLFRMNQCVSCGCGYLSPRPSREKIADYYPREFYWSWEGESSALDWQTIVDKRRHQLEEKGKWLNKVSPGKLLDIGAQKGEFLWYMKERGWCVEGVELDSTVPNPAGMPIRYGDFLEMEFSDASYDVITLWAVLEHVYEPSRFIMRAKQLLKPGGRIIVVATNLSSVQSRFYQADDYPRHLTIFTKKSVNRLCANQGLKMTRFHTGQEIYGGTLNGGLLYLCKRLFGYSSAEAFAEWKQIKDPSLFWCKWRGDASLWIKNVSRLDRVLTYLPEKLLDRMGFGLILSFEAIKE